MLEMGICEVLIPLTNSSSFEVQENSAAALGNLSFKERRTASDDYSAFNAVWDKPEGGMHDYLYCFLTSPDATFQYIAVWTIVQLLESGNSHLIANIRSSPLLAPHIRELAISPNSTPTSSVGTSNSVRSHSDRDVDTDDGQEEIYLLARKILGFIDGDIDRSMTPSVTTPERDAVGSVDGNVIEREHDKLGRSVQNAFSQNR